MSWLEHDRHFPKMVAVDTVTNNKIFCAYTDHVPVTQDAFIQMH